ncbi:MAG: chemotaxis protein CheA [Leptonema sp. (in: bacteria)]
MNEEILNQIKVNIHSIEEGNLIKVVEFKGYFDNLIELYKQHLQDGENQKKLDIWRKKILKFLKNPKEIQKVFKEIEEVSENFTNFLSTQDKEKFIKYLESKIEKVDTKESLDSFDDYNKNYFDNIVVDVDLLKKFYYEAEEHLNNVQTLLIEIEYDPTNYEFLNIIFRDLHTIKGSSSFLGLKNFEEVSHTLEELLSKARDKKVTLNKDVINIIFLGAKILRTLLDILILELNEKEFSLQNLIKNFQQINIFPFVNFIRDFVSKLEFKKIGEILQEESKLKISEIEELLKKQSQVKKPFGVMAVKEGLIEEKDLEIALQKQKEIKKRIAESHYVKVSSIKLNTLVDLIGELVINQSILKQKIQETKTKYNIELYDKTIQQLDSITSMIKNIVLTLGMVPIREIFNKLKITARNTAKDLNKLVFLETEGDDTELDRSIIEILYEPLVHLLRNSIDHGIESPEEREKKLKPKVGKIFLKAENKGSEIWILIQDDGKGIQKDKILKKALEKHLIDKEKISSITDKEIYEIMFLPSLSTKDEATSISGRGVGLDVVKKNIESINGKIEVESKENEYTKFLLKLPLTLAIIDGFVVQVHNNKYVFPFNFIEEIYIFKLEEILIYQNREMVNRRGNLIPILYLEAILENKKEIQKKEIYKSIIVRYENQSLCIVVDEILGKQEIVIRNLGNIIKNKKFSGGTIFGDGNIGFVLDMEGFLNSINI